MIKVSPTLPTFDDEQITSNHDYSQQLNLASSNAMNQHNLHCRGIGSIFEESVNIYEM